MSSVKTQKDVGHLTWTLMGVHMQTFISTIAEKFPPGTLRHSLSSAILGTWTSHYPGLYPKLQLNTAAQL